MNQIKIGESEYPVFFDWLAIEDISANSGHHSLDETANQLNVLAGSMKFTREVAYQGIRGGYRAIGVDCPFKSSEDLVCKVRKFTELKPCINWYTEAVAEFYKSDEVVEVSEGAKKK